MDPNDELNNVELQTNENVTVTKSFEKMGLRKELLRGIYSHGFVKPSAIQQRAIVPIINGRDVIAQAQSGTGKTATFSTAILQCINTNKKETQALVLSPTRELAVQTQKIISSLGDYMNVQSYACVGGGKLGQEMKKLKQAQHVVSGTPGRVLDMFRRSLLSTRHIKLLVIDEADEMLTEGFKEQIHDVYRRLPPMTQICLMSATLENEIVEMTEKFMVDPVKIFVKRDEITLQGIQQYYVDVCKHEFKYDTLKDLYAAMHVNQAIIFCNTKKKVDWLQEKLERENFTVLSMHGGMEQKQREIVMRRFRASECRVLISTDIWARGIDVQQVSHVINYDLPLKMEQYIHRIGRSGRFGRKGTAINFVTKEDKQMISKLKKFYSTSIKPLPHDVTNL